MPDSQTIPAYRQADPAERGWQLANLAAVHRERSALASRRAYLASTPTVMASFPDLTGWTLNGTPGLQVSGGAIYALDPGGGRNGGNYAYPLATGEELRAVFTVYRPVPVGVGGGTIVGVSSDAAGATPTLGATAALGMYFLINGEVRSFNGTASSILATTSGAETWTVTVLADATWISVVATNGTAEYRVRRARSGFTIGNLYVFNSCANTTGGNAVRFIAARRSQATFGMSAAPTGLSRTAHWTGDGTNSFKLSLPVGYSSLVGTRLAVLWHGNGSDENHYADNANGKVAQDAFLAAGYAVMTAAYSANLSTWGATASLNAYRAAYDYFRARYAFTTVVYYGNSMGAIEALGALGKGTIPGVTALIGTVPATSLQGNRDYGNSGTTFRTLIDTAWGVAGDGSDYATKTAGSDPQLMDPKRFGGIPMYFLVATDDVSVIPARNADVFIPRVTPYVREMVRADTTGGHGVDLTSHMAAMIAFANRHS